MKRMNLLGWATLAFVLSTLSGCVPPVEAIVLSNEQLLVDRNTQPVNIQVWNGNADLALATVDIRPSKPWIQTNVSVITSTAPSGASFDKKTVKITIDRRALKAGTYNEEIVFAGRNLVSKTLAIRVIQDVDGTQSDALNIIDRGVTYEKPYLISFNFRLEDANGNAIVGEPAQFTVGGREGDTEVSNVTGIYLRRAAARQLKAAVVFDYSLSMHLIPGAVSGMEDAAKTDFLSSLNNDALVSLYEFHVESVAPQQVTGFTADRDFLVNRINHLEEEYVNGFTGGSRAWDALVLAASGFGNGTSTAEDRYVLLFTDGKDTSSTNTVNDVIEAAVNRGVRIFVLGFGSAPNEADLEAIATGTGGAYFPAQNASQLQESFEKIITDLEGQYVLRWASLKRGTAQFLPSFSISQGNASDTFTATRVFNVQAQAGNELQGKLRIVPSEDEVNSIAFLRADYVPRNVRRLRFFLASTADFAVSVVGPGDDGLLGAWSKSETQGIGGRWIDLTAPNSESAIPFATFGPLLRIDFDGVVDDLAKPFSTVFVDNTVYANGQSFVVEGYTNVLPTE